MKFLPLGLSVIAGGGIVIFFANPEVVQSRGSGVDGPGVVRLVV